MNYFCIPPTGSNPSKFVGQFFWQTNVLKVYFDPASQAILDAIIETANEWSKYCAIRFVETKSKNESHIRVCFGERGWSYIGSDAENHKGDSTMRIPFIGPHFPTFKQIIWHLFGHALGLEHEYQPLMCDWDNKGVREMAKQLYPTISEKIAEWIIEEKERPDEDYNQAIQMILKHKMFGFDSNSIMLFPHRDDLCWATEMWPLDRVKISAKDIEWIRSIYPLIGEREFKEDFKPKPDRMCLHKPELVKSSSTGFFVPEFFVKQQVVRVFFLQYGQDASIWRPFCLKVLGIANEWQTYSNIKFVLWESQAGSDVIVDFKTSEFGTRLEDKAKDIDKEDKFKFVNLNRIHLSDDENFIKWSVLHQFGHVIGLGHWVPQMNLDDENLKTYLNFAHAEWDEQNISVVFDSVKNVPVSPVRKSGGNEFGFDPDSVMLMPIPQLVSGVPMKFNPNISWTDSVAASKLKRYVKGYSWGSTPFNPLLTPDEIKMLN